MSMVEVLVVTCAACFVFAPQVVAAASWGLSAVLQRPARGPVISYQAAMVALASVRQRLLATEQGEIPNDAAAAIEVITHALVSGSDK